MKLIRSCLATVVWILVGASKLILLGEPHPGSSVNVSGNVRDAKGDAVGGITVIAQVGDNGGVVPPAVTDSKGVFLLPLAPGVYKLFAMDDSRGYPDCRMAFFSCDGASVVVKGDGASPSVTLNVAKGAYIDGTVVDSQNLSKVDQAFVIVRRADDYYLDSRALVGSSFRMLVPAETGLTLLVAAMKYRLWTYREVSSGDISFKVPMDETFKVKIEMFRVEK